MGKPVASASIVASPAAVGARMMSERQDHSKVLGQIKEGVSKRQQEEAKKEEEVKQGANG